MNPATLPLPPEPPSRLSGEAADLWRRTVAHAPWLRLSDALYLEVYCTACTTWQADTGNTDLGAVVIDMASALGLTPAGRARLRRLGVDLD